MLTNIFNNFFHPISITFLILLLGAAMIGLGVGFWIWGTLAKRLAASYERISQELNLVVSNKSSGNLNDTNELNKLRKFARQVEEERNRLLVDNNLYQKQSEMLAELEKERNLLWQELLDLKAKMHLPGNSDAQTWKVENKKLQNEVSRLRDLNQTLQYDLDTQLDYLKNQLLQEVDIQDDLERSLQQVRLELAQVIEERNDWKNSYEIEKYNNANRRGNKVEIEANDYSVKTMPSMKTFTENTDNEGNTWKANDANFIAERKQEVSQLLEDRWLITSPDDRDMLQRIIGIGPVLEQRLNDLGIYSFEQLSRLDDFLIQKIAEALDCPPQRIIKDNWVGQAKELTNK